MSDHASMNHIASAQVVYRLPGMDAVHVRRDLPFQSEDGNTLAMDLYLPTETTSGGQCPLVVLVAGYPDPGFERIMGRRFKEMGSSVCWARLIAASGLAAAVSTNRRPDADGLALLGHLSSEADALGIDANRIGLWASSGNGPVAVSMLLGSVRPRVRCAALLYPYLLDLDGATGVADAAATFRFANPCAGRTMDDLAPDVPVFIARAGQDLTARLNEGVDHFTSAALAANLPVTVTNHPTGPHAFDVFDDSDRSRRVVAQVLSFLRLHLAP